MLPIGKTAVALILMTLVIGYTPFEVRAQHVLRVGESWAFELEGNPSTGYQWRVNKAASTGLGLIRLESLGYANSRKTKPGKVGAPAPFKFRITGLKPGSTRLVFDYSRAWEQRPPNTQRTIELRSPGNPRCISFLFGSLADIGRISNDVRSTPKTDILSLGVEVG